MKNIPFKLKMLFLLFGQLMVKFGLLFISTSGHCALVSKESELSHNQNYSQTCPIDRLTDMFVWRTHLRIKMLKVEHTHGERDFILNGPFLGLFLVYLWSFSNIHTIFTTNTFKHYPQINVKIVST